MANYIVLFATIFLSALANVLLKKGSFVLKNASMLPKSIKEIFEFVILIFQDIYVWGGLFCFGLAFILWVWLLSKMQLNIFYPIALSSQIVLIGVASRFLFKEPLSLLQLVGISTIILGVFLLAKIS